MLKIKYLHMLHVFQLGNQAFSIDVRSTHIGLTIMTDSITLN